MLEFTLYALLGAGVVTIGFLTKMAIDLWRTHSKSDR